MTPEEVAKADRSRDAWLERQEERRQELLIRERTRSIQHHPQAPHMEKAVRCLISGYRTPGPSRRAKHDKAGGLDVRGAPTANERLLPVWLQGQSFRDSEHPTMGGFPDAWARAHLEHAVPRLLAAEAHTKAELDWISTSGHR